MRAVTKLSGYLEGYNFCTGDPAEDQVVKDGVHSLIETARTCPVTFDESTMFQGEDAKVCIHIR